MDEPAHDTDTADSDTAEARPEETTTAGPVVRHVLVLPDRESAEEIAEELGEDHDLEAEPQVIREALAGEDDAEDAQWLVVVDDTRNRLDVAALDSLATGYEGWLERD